MAEPRRPRLHTIPAHRGFADALVAGLMRRSGGDPLTLAQGMILLPTNRGVRAVTDAFVRASGGGLILPRMVALGDPELGEAAGSALDPADAEAPPPPAVAPSARRMILARLVEQERQRAGQPVTAAEAVRLAGDLARTLDQMLVEEVDPAELGALDLGPELTEHWQSALATFSVVLDRWPPVLERMGRIDAARRRTLLLDRTTRRWAEAQPAGFVCAAGVTDTAPAVARLLRCVSEMPGGSVVFAGLDLTMPDEEWDALGPHKPDPETGRTRRAIETHPQCAMKLLLDRMGVGRGEVTVWRGGGDYDAGAARGRAIANAMAPADFTGKWTDLPAEDRRLSGVSTIELATPAEEAQAIALALREAIEEPGRTAALVTPDRALARRVAAHCRRWNILIDDTAGRPLSILLPGTFLLQLAEAAAQHFAPLPLLALLKHPLIRGEMERVEWLDGVRALDKALRGPRPAPGLDGIAAHVADEPTASAFWARAAPMLKAVGRTFGDGPQGLRSLLACLRECGQTLCGDALWTGPAGRAAAEFLAGYEEEADHGPARVDPAELPGLLRSLFDEIAIRAIPREGQHPRLAIYGPIEARLQTADLMIASGLNEGVWPGRPAPDPWLAPRIRSLLGLVGLEQRIGIAAHDLAQAMGAPRAILTRARRDASGPTLASRFWLRLQAMAGDRFEAHPSLAAWAVELDQPSGHYPATRPEPSPPAALRPTTISVTEVDRLKADPYAFYARRVLRLSPLDPVDADPSAAWRGTAVHDILEMWWKEDRCDVEALRPRALAMLRDQNTHPMMRALWQPRLIEAINWIAAEVATKASEGRHVLSAEGKGRAELAGVTLTGRFDRIDKAADGSLVVIDYKTGKPPSTTAVREGFSLQLGLLGLIAERGGFEGVAGKAGGFEYWSLGRGREGLGYIATPVDPDGKRERIRTDEFVSIAAANFAEAAGQWLTGDAPFTAKLVPEYAPYAEYDQLMRRDEWYGRDR